MIYGGMEIFSDPHMVETVEDWSDVRSPSRAARRRRQGHTQRIKYVTRPMRMVYHIGNRIVGHPDIIESIVRETKRSRLR